MKPYRGRISVEHTTDCPYSIAQDYIEEYLRDAEFGGEASIVYAGPLGRRVTMTFGLRTDSSERGRAHEEILLAWRGRSVVFPDFHGTLKLRIHKGGSGTRLILSGEYRPPGGALGALFDRVAGRRIARATADRFLERICEAIAARDRAWRREAERRNAEFDRSAAGTR